MRAIATRSQGVGPGAAKKQGVIGPGHGREKKHFCRFVAKNKRPLSDASRDGVEVQPYGLAAVWLLFGRPESNPRRSAEFP